MSKNNNGDTYINKGLILSTLTIILLLFQNPDSTIFIESALIFTSLGLVKVNKDKGRKFEFYAWSFMFVIFVSQFILKAFILV